MKLIQMTWCCSVKVGDIVRIKGQGGTPTGLGGVWPESHGQIGVIVSFGKRLYIPEAKVMVLGEIAEFDLDELEAVNESR